MSNQQEVFEEDTDWLYSNEDLDVDEDQENVLLQTPPPEQQFQIYEDPFLLAPPLDQLFGYELDQDNEEGQLIGNEMEHQGILAAMEVMHDLYGEEYGPPGA